MSQETGPVSPRQDEQQAHETQGLVNSGHPTRVEEHRDPEPAGEDQPTTDGTLADLPGTPPGMDSGDVEQRSEIARFLGTSAFPGDRDALVATAQQNQATDRVVGLLQQLPGGEYENVQAVARALGLGTEQHRT